MALEETKVTTPTEDTEKTEKAVAPKQDDVIDININVAERQKFRVNGQPNSIIELNLSDMGIFERLSTSYDRLQNLVTDMAEIDTDADDFSEKFHQADKAMRDEVDYIFDYPVSDICCRYGTMYDLKNGMFRFEQIIDALTKLYHNNLHSEFAKMRARVGKHTAPYTVPTKTKSKKKG